MQNKIRSRSYEYEAKLVRIFFFLVLFDGILRKWLLAPISTPVMIVKQIFAIYMIFIGYRKGIIKNGWATFSIILGYISFITTLLFGHQNLLVTIWGCMNWWFGIPLCIFIGNVLDKKDILKMVKYIVIFSIVHGVITAIQYFSPIISFINRQIGGDTYDISQYNISELGGGFRCSGIFGYINQASNFAPLALGCILFILLYSYDSRHKKRNKIINILGVITFILPCVFAISRTTVFISIISFLFMMPCILLSIRKIKHIFIYVISFFLLFISLSFIPAINMGIDTLSDRFETASEHSFKKKKTTLQGNIDDLLGRGFKYTLEAVVKPETLDGEDVPFWGYGQGMSTQVGGRIMNIKKHSGFALAEWDSKRIVCESGLLLGLFMMTCRLGFVLSLFPKVYYLMRHKYYLPWLLYPSFFFGFFFLNAWGNSFLFNFALLCGGLCYASIKNRFKF